MTPEEHRKRHWELHQAFDELLADFFLHHPRKHAWNTSLAELILWAYEQTSVPTEVREI